MPNITNGFTGTEIVNRVLAYIGSSNSSLQTYIQQSLPLAEFRYCKMSDWGFLYKAGLALTVTNGTSEYDLSIANIGFTMDTADVETIYSHDGVVLKRQDLNQIRRIDPDENDGSTTDTPTLWSSVSDNRIKIWPPSIETGTLYIDGKIQPGALHTLSNFPTIPYKNQEGFIAYVTAMALDFENDDRAATKMQEAMALIKQDIQDDLSDIGNVENPRIRSMLEQRYDGVGASVDALRLGWFDYE